MLSSGKWIHLGANSGAVSKPKLKIKRLYPEKMSYIFVIKSFVLL